MNETKKNFDGRETRPASQRSEIPARLFSSIRESGPDNFSRQYSVKYLGNTENVDPADLKKAEKMLNQCLDFLKENAKTPVECKVTEVLASFFNSGNVVLCDSMKMFGRPAYGGFYSDESKTYIAIDLDTALSYGMGELIDTVFHEGYHAAQNSVGHKNGIVKEETRAWNLGLLVSNAYRAEHGEQVVRTTPYTEKDIASYMGYDIGGRCGFVEIC